MADLTIIEQSGQVLDNSTPMTSKEFISINDQNSGFYSNSFRIETSSLANSGKLISLSESELQIPLVVTLRGVDATKPINQHYNSFKYALKSNTIHLIDSLLVQYQNSVVQSITPRSNFYYNYKFLEELSQEQVDLYYGEQYMIYPDSEDSWEYYNADAPVDDEAYGGFGSKNNRVFSAKTKFIGTAADVVKGFTDGDAVDTSTLGIANEGFFKRCKAINENYDTVEKGMNTINSELNARDARRNYQIYDATSNSLITFVVATIPLNAFSFFQNLPLIRGCYISLQANLNLSLNNLTISGNKMVYTQAPQIVGNSNPIMIASAEHYGNKQPLGSYAVDQAGDDDEEVVFACGVVKSKDTAVNTQHYQTAVQLRACCYTMSPEAESRYMQMNSTKLVRYNDIINYTMSVDANSSFNQTLSNGCADMQKLYIFCMYQSGANPLNDAATVFAPPHQSSFASEPATCSPLIYLSQFNVQVAGQNVFNSNRDYSFEHYLENRESGSMNGNLIRGVTSGLISYKKFKNNYGVIVVPLNRRLKESNKVPLSLSITGQLKSNMPCDLHCFIEYSKEIKISPESGAILE